MFSAPLPSKLTLLSSLPSQEFGEKVRFLGCVTSYSMASAQLTLHHDFPKQSGVNALVDVRLLLERLTAEQTSVGQWVNIIGYISSAPSAPVKRSSNRRMEHPTVHVQALMLWSAGPLDIGRYETWLARTTGKDGPEIKYSKPDKT
ncbi:hypothetical protein VP1G_10959 [Cytospora mali]|uniref:Telomere length regulation/capping, TEN1 n=1 Tax=Cytospora mali TaxID=578113 RepID=A0A194V414_CYTMA|nr:hypothetical protein VP1G_10959 [Valsa mali var. pyri (nom. inval.)]